jgi:hypothetical protein
MKSILALVAFAALAVLSTGSGVRADNKVFIIASQSGGYGIDECLANGEKCGAYAARSYCQSREFTEATAYRRVERDEVTGALPQSTGGHCQPGGCADYIAITCHR